MLEVRRSGRRRKDETRGQLQAASVQGVRFPVEPEREAGRQTPQDYWRTHTWMNGHEQELEVGMASHVTEKGRVIHYSVGVIK